MRTRGDARRRDEETTLVIGWCVKCEVCKYARYNLGGKLEASCKAIQHRSLRRHDVVAWKESTDIRMVYHFNEPDAPTLYEGRYPF